MEKVNKDLQEKIQRLQILEQNLQNMLLQKQAFEFELNEVSNALKEVSETKDDIFKLVGSIMIKASKESVERELTSKKEILALRVKSIEKQERQFREETEKLREQVMKNIK